MTQLWTWKWGIINVHCSPPPGSSDCRWFSWAQPVTWRVLNDDEINKCYFPWSHQAGQVSLCLVLPGDDWQLLLWLLPLPNTMFVPIISRVRGKRAGSDCTDYLTTHRRDLTSLSSSHCQRSQLYSLEMFYYDVLITQQDDRDWSIAGNHHILSSHSLRSNVNT